MGATSNAFLGQPRVTCNDFLGHLLEAALWHNSFLLVTITQVVCNLDVQFGRATDTSNYCNSLLVRSTKVLVWFV